jgi:hypothetical protein
LQMPTAPEFNTKPCGSGLAREGVSTSNITTSRPTAIASKLAPTMDCECPQHPDSTPNPATVAQALA